MCRLRMLHRCLVPYRGSNPLAAVPTKCGSRVPPDRTAAARCQEAPVCQRCAHIASWSTLPMQARRGRGCGGMLPTATMAGARRSPARPELRGGFGAGHSVDRTLLTLCLLASLLLLYRCIVVTGGLLPGGGAGAAAAAAAGATVISTTTTVHGGSGGAAAAAASGVVTELVVDRFGRARSTTVTRSEAGTTITVTGSGGAAAAALRGRRAALHGGSSGGSTARRSGRAAIAAAAAARGRGRQHGPKAFPGLPADFDAQVGAGCTLRCLSCVCTGRSAGPPCCIIIMQTTRSCGARSAAVHAPAFRPALTRLRAHQLPC